MGCLLRGGCGMSRAVACRVGLVTAGLLAGGAVQDADGFPVDDQPEAVVLGEDGDGLARVGHAGLDALAGDLDAAPAGYPPLHGDGRWRQRGGPGQADALQPVPLAWWDGTGQGAP